ncbi:hypothetical protein ACFQX6_59535 [Streptosporangium lutulentum]
MLLVIALAAGTLAVRQGMAADARSAVLASQRDSAEARRSPPRPTRYGSPIRSGPCCSAWPPGGWPR